MNNQLRAIVDYQAKCDAELLQLAWILQRSDLNMLEGQALDWIDATTYSPFAGLGYLKARAAAGMSMPWVVPDDD